MGLTEQQARFNDILSVECPPGPRFLPHYYGFSLFFSFFSLVLFLFFLSFFSFFSFFSLLFFFFFFFFLFSCPLFLKLSTVINMQKGGTIFFCLFLMFYFDNFSCSATVYTARKLFIFFCSLSPSPPPPSHHHHHLYRNNLNFLSTRWLWFDLVDETLCHERQKLG